MQIKKNYIISFIAIIVILFLVYYLSSNIKEKFTIKKKKWSIPSITTFAPTTTQRATTPRARAMNLGWSYTCNKGGSAGPGAVYRLVETNPPTLRHYPNPQIATQWDAKWGVQWGADRNIDDCTKFTFGDPMSDKTKTPMATTPIMVTTSTPVTFKPTIKKKKWNL